MNDIGVVQTCRLIEAHFDNDENKFISYCKFIAEGYRQRGELRAEKMILSRLDGSYKNEQSMAVMDKLEG